MVDLLSPGLQRTEAEVWVPRDSHSLTASPWWESCHGSVTLPGGQLFCLTPFHSLRLYCFLGESQCVHLRGLVEELVFTCNSFFSPEPATSS